MTGGEDDQWLQLVGIFVGTPVFHVELTLCIAGCNLENVAGPAPASRSGLHELTYGYRSNLAAPRRFADMAWSPSAESGGGGATSGACLQGHFLASRF